MLIVREKVSSYVESVCDFFNKNMRSKKYVSTTQNVAIKNPLKNYITLLIVNTYADEYYGSTALDSTSTESRDRKKIKFQAREKRIPNRQDPLTRIMYPFAVDWIQNLIAYPKRQIKK